MTIETKRVLCCAGIAFEPKSTLRSKYYRVWYKGEVIEVKDINEWTKKNIKSVK